MKWFRGAVVDPDRLRAAFDALAEGVTLADATGRITYSNPAADHILGTRASDAPPDQWAEHYGVFLPGTDEPFPTDGYPLVRALAGEETDGVEMWIRNPNVPSGALIQVSGRPVRNGGSEITGAAVVFRDVTVLRQAEGELRRTVERLEALRAQKDELMGFLVHDMKGPLTAIMAAAEMLQVETEDPGAREDVAGILEGAGELHRMVLDLLDIQTAEDGKLQPDLEPVRVRALLQRVASAASVKGAQVVVDAAAEDVVMADPALLRRVVANLVDNCIKYGEEGGRIWLSGHTTDDRLRLSVKDQGPGVPAELREAIFDKYARLERDAGRRRAGSRGLGLRFCKVAVEAHGGRVWVEANQPRGAAFHVEIPAGADG